MSFLRTRHAPRVTRSSHSKGHMEEHRQQAYNCNNGCHRNHLHWTKTMLCMVGEFEIRQLLTVAPMTLPVSKRKEAIVANKESKNGWLSKNQAEKSECRPYRQDQPLQRKRRIRGRTKNEGKEPISWNRANKRNRYMIEPLPARRRLKAPSQRST